MALYKELQQYVSRLIAAGTVSPKMTGKELKAVYSAAVQGLYIFGAVVPDSRRKHPCLNERLSDFIAECARQCHGLPVWPENATSAAIKKASKLGVTVEDLPYIAEAKRLGVWEDYCKVMQYKGRHLPLKLYLEAVSVKAVLPDHGDWMSEGPKKWSHFLSCCKRVKVDGANGARAYSRLQIEGSGDFANFVYSLGLDDKGYAFFKNVSGNRYACQLYLKGVIDVEFAERYGHYIDRSWLEIEKITKNPLWDQIRSKKLAVMLYQGYTPQYCASNFGVGQGYSVQMDGLDLTKSEAAEWISAYCARSIQRGDLNRAPVLSPVIFLADKLGIPYPELVKFRSTTRPLLEWYARKRKLASMTKERVVHGPEGMVKTFCFRDLLDELTEADLGPADAPLAIKLNQSPEKVFEAAAKRRMELYLKRFEESVKLPRLKFEKELPAGIRQITNSADLLGEGERMSHCVGGYIDSCLNKRSFIFVVKTEAGRSTVEICPHVDGGYWMAQHYGYGNTAPASDNQALVHRWCIDNDIEHPLGRALPMAANG